MSTHRVDVVTIDEILPHPNADRLELARVKGWNIVVGKNHFKSGELAIYIPVDSILPESLEEKLFPPDAKIKLHNHRIRSIKIRGAMSQGMLITPAEIGVTAGLFPGDDLADVLGITKYEPPVPGFQQPGNGKNRWGRRGYQPNPNFEKYTHIENIKNYPNVFNDGEIVYISEKMHGTAARYGYVPRNYAHGLMGRLKRVWDNAFIKLGLKTEHEYVYGSHHVQLHDGHGKSWYRTDVYAKIGRQYELRDALKKGECVYGEICGDGIQKNYSYGCGPGQHFFMVYDVMVDGKYLNYTEFADWCDQRGFTRVPKLYVGPYSKEVELAHRDGDSTVGGQKVREGVVVKPIIEDVSTCGRKVLKSISDAYYLEENTEYH